MGDIVYDYQRVIAGISKYLKENKGKILVTFDRAGKSYFVNPKTGLMPNPKMVVVDECSSIVINESESITK